MTEKLEFLPVRQKDFVHSRLRKSGDGLWCVNNSDIKDYSRRARIFGRNSGLLEVLKTNLNQNDPGVGLDIAAGSLAVALRDLADMELIQSGLATNYEDRRSFRVAEDQRIGHVSGDITEQRTWDEIERWRQVHAPDGFSVAMHRPVGGLQDLPDFTYEGAVHAVLDMVQDEGVFFTQIPRTLVDNPRLLGPICKSIHDRPDVDRILSSGRPNWFAHVDESDSFAVIIKN